MRLNKLRDLQKFVGHVFKHIDNSFNATNSLFVTDNRTKISISQQKFLQQFGLAKRKQTGEPNPMLTFFEYLRNRAYESIVEGASEALAYLEQEENTSFEKMAEAAPLPPRKRKAIGSENKLNESDSDPNNSDSQEDCTETPQAPRKRGRPRKNESGQ